MSLPSFKGAQESYKGFIVTKVKKIEELALYVIELVHEKTGARVVHLQNSDPENVFCISFQTLPSSSNGVAHILEHTVLCGSKKYPVKDPFFSMIRRSLHTFMNAFTGMDFTCYPASSENVKDFYHLLDVYIDATFFPNLDRESFLQEGHRLEFLRLDDPKSPLTYRGVVFNEMKGAMSTMESRFWQHMFEHLYPDLPYKYNSGGDPAAIPALTHEELIDFHTYFYNPSNAVFFFYGNIPTQKHLDFLENRLLKDVEKKPIHSPIAKQKRFSSPLHVEKPYPAKKGESDVIGFGFLTAHLGDLETIMALTLLESILLDTDASPLKKALMDFGITSVESYFETEISEAPFILVFKGCGDKSAKEIEEKLFHALRDIAKEKISQEKILEALHALEFSRKEISHDHYPYGLSLFMRSILPKQHGVDTVKSLEIDEVFTKLKNRAKNPEFIPLLIHEYFLENPHFVSLTLKPDEALVRKEQEDEQTSLVHLKEKLTEKEKGQLVKEAKHLASYQEKMESASLDCLPKISLKDVQREGKFYPLEKTEIFWKNTFTNHIVYVDVAIELPKIDQKELAFLPLFADFLSELGTKKRNFSENLSYINAHLGGLESYISLNIQAENPENISPLLILRAKALYKNTDKIFEIYEELFDGVDFSDLDRIEKLLEKEKVELKSQMVSQAMHYAKSLARSGIKNTSYLYDLLYGFRYFKTVEELGKNPRKSAEMLSKIFTSWKDLFFQQKMDWIITCDEKHYKELEKKEFFQVTKRPHKKAEPFSLEDASVSLQQSEGFLIPSPVAFTALSLPATGYLDPTSPALLAAAELMQNTVLHKEIREKGGAYGSGAHFDPLRGDFTFRAYRDPHLFSSLNVFKQAFQELEKEAFSQRDLEDAILGVIQDLDQPLSPGSEGLTTYLREKKGITKNVYQKIRDRILSLKKGDIKQAVQKVHAFDSSVTISFSNGAFFAKENEKMPIPLPLKKT